MSKRILALVASAALLGACSEGTTVPDYNNVSAEALAKGLSPAAAQLLTTGLINQHRNSAIGNYVVFPETMARDAWRMDKAETRYLTEIIGSQQPDAGAFTGQGVYTGFFIGIRAANTMIHVVDGATDASGIDAAGRSGLLGIARTLKALNYWNVIEVRDTIGMPIDLDIDYRTTPAPWRCKQNVLAYISALLDSAATDLGAAGSSFPVKLPPGYAMAADPAGFLAFNRALKGKVELYRGLQPGVGTAANFTAAATALGQSFMQSSDLSAAGLAEGVYQNYSTAPGETSNALVDPALHLSPAVMDSIQPGDLRASKITKSRPDTLPFNVTINGVTFATTYDYTYSLGATSLTHALPIIRNEELLLLRAQVAIEQNDLATATTYLNYVRQNAGGLPAYTLFADQASARNALLYEKRYSLLMEGPQRLLDLRAYGRMNSTSFTPGSTSSKFTNDAFTNVLPIPINELNARGGSAPMTCN